MKKKLNADKALRQPYPGDGGRKMIFCETTNEVNSIVARKRETDLNFAFELWAVTAGKLFPKATPKGGMIHAKKECQEVIKELKKSSVVHENLATEYADILMCVCDSMNRAGVSIGDVVFALHKKIKVNKSRKWKYNDDGSYSHIK